MWLIRMYYHLFFLLLMYVLSRDSYSLFLKTSCWTIRGRPGLKVSLTTAHIPMFFSLSLSLFCLFVFTGTSLLYKPTWTINPFRHWVFTLPDLPLKSLLSFCAFKRALEPRVKSIICLNTEKTNRTLLIDSY